eukprot:GHVP01039053.1.p1 GENE.GHVP01039053.1~~GHVP01039053.1.p1  ORF type:complete len:225 (+),score=27.00 GHVP01039053.1:62-736(+)
MNLINLISLFKNTFAGSLPYPDVQLKGKKTTINLLDNEHIDVYWDPSFDTVEDFDLHLNSLDTRELYPINKPNVTVNSANIRFDDIIFNDNLKPGRYSVSVSGKGGKPKVIPSTPGSSPEFYLNYFPKRGNDDQLFVTVYETVTVTATEILRKTEIEYSESYTTILLMTETITNTYCSSTSTTQVILENTETSTISRPPKVTHVSVIIPGELTSTTEWGSSFTM